MSLTDCKGIMVVIETADGAAKSVGLEMLTPAKEIASAKGTDVTAVMIGEGLEDAAKQAASYGADKIITVDNNDLKAYSEKHAAVLKELIEKYKPETVLIGATQNGKDIAPIVAGKLGLGCVTDVVSIKLGDDGKIVFTCPMYSGNILSDNVIDTVPQIATVRGGSFKKGEPKDVELPEEVVIAESMPYGDIKTTIKETVKEISEAVNLEDAQVIVSGGRGMGSAENFKLVEELANVLGGVVGATRAPVEDGWISRAHQIGQSGKIVAPKLYIACGISGATQHVTGMVGSDYIVAINKDEDAPIFDIANVGIVGNVMQVIPAMIEEIKKLKA
ncbi:MAG: electron transfer flavoprotein subunit alpha/FixB family protein [Clostridia bacterium]|jgi:electron transfer flavoprotein alpha subunit|nr:electron transfer flavoprotein subunit alpha/FixB family protein [Clostridia bacterium]